MNYETEIDIDAPAERLWRALTSAPELERWFCEHADVDIDAKRFEFWGRFTPGNPPREQGTQRVTDLSIHERLGFDWRWNDCDTKVTISLRPAGNGTTVNVLHEGVRDRMQPTEHVPSHLWSTVLGHLKTYVENDWVGPRYDWAAPHMGGFTVAADIEATPEQVWEQLVPLGYESPTNPIRRPGRNENEDFAYDVGVIEGIKVLDVKAPARYQLEWGVGSRTPSILTYTLDGSEGRTRITIVQSSFTPEAVAHFDVEGMAEGFFSGLYDIAVKLALGTVPPPATRQLQPVS
jgi:uncharacterized protein YndB with AHSA1/START domain